MSSVEVKNTLCFTFENGCAKPTLNEIADFVKSLNADAKEMEATYRISEERSIFIKFKSENPMLHALRNNQEEQFFRYENGITVKVHMSPAAGNVQYVRLYDLPPEVPDNAIVSVLEKYGKIKRVVRERFPEELGLNMHTGVRGVYMDVKSELPSSLHFMNRKGNIFYEGNKNLCFLCKLEGHLMNSCPKRKARKQQGTRKSKEGPKREEQQQDQEQGSSSTYAGVVTESVTSHETGHQTEQEEEEEEAVAAAANVGNALSGNKAEEADSGKENQNETESIEIGETTVAEENFDMSTWHRIAHCIKDFNMAKTQQEAEEQKKQGKKSGARLKTGFSPPMKKKY